MSCLAEYHKVTGTPYKKPRLTLCPVSKQYTRYCQCVKHKGNIASRINEMCNPRIKQQEFGAKVQERFPGYDFMNLLDRMRQEFQDEVAHYNAYPGAPPTVLPVLSDASINSLSDGPLNSLASVTPILQQSLDLRYRGVQSQLVY